MEEYLNIETMTHWLMNYGSITLFILLALGIIALPIPEETLLTISGIFIYKGLLNFPITFVAAFLGSVCGITVSYLIGLNIGIHLLHKYGKWVGLTEKRLQLAHQWFEKYGKWTLFIGYFLPGIRHLSGISAGLTELEYRHFALYAYCGAFFWVLLFLSIGYFFGDYWMAALEYFEESYLGIIPLLLAIITIIFLVVYYRRK